MSNNQSQNHNSTNNISHDKKVEGGKHSHSENYSKTNDSHKKNGNNPADNIPHDKKVEGGKH